MSSASPPPARLDGASFLTKGELAYQILRRDILDGELAPGEIINQVDLASRIQMSTTPVREALNRLQADGLVYTDAYRDTHVVPLNAEEARDIYELRRNLDPLAARLAAQRHTEADVTTMKAAASRLEEEPNSIEVHYLFHRALYSCSGNEMLTTLLDTVWARSDRYRRFGEGRLTVVPESVRLEEHLNLLDLILKRDSDGVDAAMARHVEHSLTSQTTKVLPTSGE